MKKLEAKQVKNSATIKGGAFGGKVKNIRIRPRGNSSGC